VESLGLPDRKRSGDPPSENKSSTPVVFTSPAAKGNRAFSEEVAKPQCVRIASRLLACSLTLRERFGEVKVIDFLLPIKIGWPRIYLWNDKLFFASLLLSGAAGKARKKAGSAGSR